MNEILKKNLTTLTLISLCLILSASCQLLIPHIISEGISGISDTGYIINLLPNLILIFIARGIFQGIADCLNSYFETSLRMDVIQHVYESHGHIAHSAFMTRITEDAERIAAAISNALYFLGSILLALFTSYLLIAESLFFLLPLTIIWALTLWHLKKSSPAAARYYRAEIMKEEEYKLSILELIRHFRTASRNDTFTQYYFHLDEVITARYDYQKLNLLICFTPELLVAIATVLIITIITMISPELFGTKYIYYLGYLGLFSMASRHSLEIALSLVGVTESMKRIFKGTEHE